MDIREELKRGSNISELNLRVCYYARVSTEHELQMTSIVNQVDFFREYIDSNPNWCFIRGYVDEGISGKDVKKRDNFLRMIEDGKRGRFDLILTKSVSRFARNTIDSIYYTNILLNMGIGVIFVNDNINTFYSDSEFRLTLMASIAQDELRKLSESVQFGLSQSINRGIVLGNNNLLGYRKDKGKLVIVPVEAMVVRDVFNLFASGEYSYSKLARVINEEYSRKLDSTSVKRILTNYKYKGYYCGRKSRVIDYKTGKRKWKEKDSWVVYLDYEKVPPIVEEELWDKVQEIIMKRSKNRASSCYHDGDDFRGKIYCKKHDVKLTHKIKKYKNKYYGYFYCYKCLSISDKVLRKIYEVRGFKRVEVMKGEEDIILKVCHLS